MNHPKKLGLVFILLAAAFTATAQSSKTLKTLDIPIRDPFVITDHSAKCYYMYLSQQGETGREVAVYKSYHLENWTGPKTVFTFPSDFWAKNSIWAPEVHRYNEKYYLFTTFTGDGFLEREKTEVNPGMAPSLRGTQILVSNSPEGPFVPFKNRPHTPIGMMTLDGTLWIEDGHPYLIYCHEWIQIHEGTIDAIRLTPDLSETVGAPFTLFKATEAPWVVDMNSLNMPYNGYVTDGNFFYRTKNGSLLMIWSSFGTDKYTLGIARSKSGKLHGPWEQIPEPMFKQDGGHGMIFRTLDNKLMLTLHQPNSVNERAHFFEIIERDDMLYLK